MCCSTYILEMNSAIVWNMICIQINKISNTLGPCGRGSWLKPCHFLWFQFSVFQKQQIKRRLSTNPQWVFLLIFVPHVQLVFVFLFVFWKRWFWGSPSQHIPMRCQWLHLSNRLMVRRFGQFLWSDLRQVETQMWWMPGGCLTRHTRKTHRIGSGWGYCSGNFPSSFVSSKLYQTGDAWAIPSWWFTHVWRHPWLNQWHWKPPPSHDALNLPRFLCIPFLGVDFGGARPIGIGIGQILWRLSFRETCERSCCFFTEMK